jgi:phosphoglycerate dehydrogenase-like enzyme
MNHNNMRVGIIGTGAVAHKPVQVYAGIGFKLTLFSNTDLETGRTVGI